jgi:hypothetical protein
MVVEMKRMRRISSSRRSRRRSTSSNNSSSSKAAGMEHFFTQLTHSIFKHAPKHLSLKHKTYLLLRKQKMSKDYSYCNSDTTYILSSYINIKLVVVPSRNQTGIT